MALQISKATDFGVNALYWRIVGANIDYAPTEQLVVRLGGYATEAARASGAEPLTTRELVFSGSAGASGPFVAEPTRAQAYAAIKSIPGWESATDV